MTLLDPLLLHQCLSSSSLSSSCLQFVVLSLSMMKINETNYDIGDLYKKKNEQQLN